MFWHPFLNVTIIMLSLSTLYSLMHQVANSSNTHIRILLTKRHYKHIPDSILAVDWDFMFDLRSLEVIFLFLYLL